jgi:hypothetical protein
LKSLDLRTTLFQIFSHIVRINSEVLARIKSFSTTLLMQQDMNV